MSIPSQLPQIITAARSGALQALALQSGQILEGTVVGAAPNGGTQVEIRGQLLNLLLPVPIRAGETIRLEVQGSGAQLKLALQPGSNGINPAPLPASPAPAAPGPQANIPLAQPPSPQMPLTVRPAAPGNAPIAAQVATRRPPALPPVLNAAPGSAPATQAPAAQMTPVSLPATATSPTPLPTAQPMMTVPLAGQVTPALPQATPQLPPSAPMSTPSAPIAVAPLAPVTGTPLPTIPYQQASPAPARPTATQLAQPASVATTAGVQASSVQAPVAGQAPVAPVTSQAAPPPTMATTPQAALAQMVQSAVPRQGSVTDLTSALTSLAGKVVLPEPVARAAQQLLSGRVSIDASKFDGTALQTAVRSSGIFQEADLARGQLPLLQPDMKTALLALRQTLTTWLGSQAPVAAIAHIPPPLKGTIPRARGGDVPPIDPAPGAEEVGKQLLDRTESALARVRLHQHASLPDPSGRTADWSMDLPVIIGQQQTLMHLQIHRDQQNDGEAVSERGWQMRFALSLPGMGEVGAQVSMRAGTTGVMLWASEPDSAAALDAEIGQLRETLVSAGIKPTAVIVRQGGAPAPAAAPSGHFVDATT